MQTSYKGFSQGPLLREKSSLKEVAFELDLKGMCRDKLGVRYVDN